MVLCFLQPVGFVTFATKDDADAAKLDLQVFIYLFRTAFTDTGLLNGFVFSFSINPLVWFVQ